MAMAENKCSICGKQFCEEDKIMLIAQAFVVSAGGGYLSEHTRGKSIHKAKVKLRFKSGQPRTLSHLSCYLEREQEGID